MPKKAAVRLWHRARRASLIATAVLHALGLLNFATGRLDPSYAAIARKANVCERTWPRRSPDYGILHWVPALYRELARRALRAGCWQEPRIPSDSRHLLEFRQVLLRRGKQMFGLPGCMSGSPPAGRRRPSPCRLWSRERLVFRPLLQTGLATEEQDTDPQLANCARPAAPRCLRSTPPAQTAAGRC